jgi:Uncharacterized protein conserved in bacteria (DUF2188)
MLKKYDMEKNLKQARLAEKFSKAAATNNRRVHIVESKDGWSVKKEGAKRATVVMSTKEAAVKAAKNVKSALRIVVHKKDGTIQTNSLMK